MMMGGVGGGGGGGGGVTFPRSDHSPNPKSALSASPLLDPSFPKLPSPQVLERVTSQWQLSLSKNVRPRENSQYPATQLLQ